MERLQKVIAQTGYCSRRKAEELIKSGKVEVNGKVITEMGVKVNFDDDITIEGNGLNLKEDKVYYIMNKPRGIITSTSDEKSRKTVVDLIEETKRIYPVGRLDYDTTGVLLLTNDGELTNLLIHPRNKIDKVYIAKVEGFFDKNSALSMSRGVLIDGVMTSKSFVKLKRYDKKTNTSIVEVVIHEGRNHQVKKMFEAVGFSVVKLKREMFAFLNVNGLKSGEYRYLSVKEVKQLYSLVK